MHREVSLSIFVEMSNVNLELSFKQTWTVQSYRWFIPASLFLCSKDFPTIFNMYGHNGRLGQQAGTIWTNYLPQTLGGYIWKMITIDPHASEKSFRYFQQTDDQRRRTTDAVYPISSLAAFGLGELETLRYYQIFDPKLLTFPRSFCLCNMGFCYDEPGDDWEC